MLSFNIHNYIIISQYSNFSAIWDWLDIIFCLMSSYLYSYIAVYSDINLNEEIRESVWFFEIFFFLAMVKNFLTDFIPVGEIKPVRNYKQIAMRYIKG
jgi:hypothetical protein